MFLRFPQLLEESSCDALLESILPKTPEGIARRLRELVQQQGGAAEDPEQQLQEWEQQGAALEEVLQAFKGEQQRKIGNQLERKRLRDILQWHYQVRHTARRFTKVAAVKCDVPAAAVWTSAFCCC